ncbi:hypothetical protein PT974_02280 [Cladobotryum mycophilum]|uniref:Uncharacterized protein n=1 Tax=Cladobotryum mycophilum TaxID=491253 RepID=A0ABR0SXR9_9HYPO
MDLLGQTITAGRLIIDFLGACSDFSDDAKSLMAPLTSNANKHLPPDDLALLERTAKYLNGFSVKAQQSLRKIE